MPRSRIPSPSRSQGVISTPRRSTRRSRSVTSPARSNKSARLSAVIASSFNLSPVPNRQSVLTDDTDVEIPTRRSWWKKLGESSTDVMEFLNNEDNADTDNVIEELNVEVITLRPSEEIHHKYHTDIPDSSDGESICSIVIPHHKLFSQKGTAPQEKFGQFINNREDLINLQKSHVDHDKDIAVAPKNLFNQVSKARSIPAFRAALLNISGNKTVDKTKEMPPPETQGQGRGLFGNRVAKKRNMFADFILSESEDEISDIQPRKFGFPKKVCTDKGETPRGKHPSSSFDMDDWVQLPSSTMVENQLDDTTPLKQVRPSILSEDNEIHKELSILDENNQHVSHSNSRTTRNKTKSIQQTSLNKTNSTKAMDKSSETISKKLANDKDINVSPEINDDNDVTIKTTSRKNSKNTSNKLQDSANTNNDKSRRSTRNKSKSIQNDSLNELNQSNIKEVSNRIEKQKYDNTINTKKKQNLNDTKNTDNTNSSSKQQEQIEQNENIPADVEVPNNDQEIILNHEENNILYSDGTEQINLNKSGEHEKMDVHEKELSRTYKYAKQNEYNDKKRKVVDGESETERNEVENDDKEESNSKIEQDVIEDDKQHGSEVINEDEEKDESEAREPIYSEKDDSEAQEQNDSDNNEKIISEAEEENDSENEEQIISEAEEQIHSESEEQIDSEGEEQINSEAEEQVIRDTEEQNISMGEGQNDNDIDERNIREVEEKNESDSHKNKSQLHIEEQNKSDRQNDDGVRDNEPNISHNTTGTHSNKEEAEMVLHNKTNQIETTECFTGRLTTLRKSSIMLKTLNLRPSSVPESNSTGFSDGTKDSSANNSGWDSHRTTRKTLRQTFGKNFSPRKSLRTLVMEKSAKRQTNFDQDKKQPSMMEFVNTKQTDMETLSKSEISLETKGEDKTCTKNIESRSSMETMVKYQTSGETVGQNHISMEIVNKNQTCMEDIDQNQISNKDMDDNQTSLEDIEHNQTSLEDIDQNQISMEDMGQNQTSSEDMDKNKSNMEDVDQNQTSMEDMDQNGSNMDDVDQNESNIENVDQNESDMDDVEQNQTSLEEIDQNESNMDDVDQNESHMEDVDQNESNIEDVDQNESNIEDEDQNESNMEDVDQNESNIEDVDQNESNTEDEDQNESHIEDVDHNESNKEDVDQDDQNQTSVEDMDQNESSNEDMDENQISKEDMNENQASTDNMDSNQKNMESLAEMGRNSMDLTTKEHLADTTNKRHTNYTEFGDHTIRNAVPLANSTKFHHFESYRETNEHDEADETEQEVVKQKRQATLEVYLKKIREENNERKRKLDEEVKTSLQQPAFTFFKVPQKPARPIKIQNQKPKPKKPVSTILPPEVLEDMKYKPPKRFKPSNASWITKRLYKFLEIKLEPKYDYKARVRAEKLVETIYNFTKDIRRHHPTAPAHLVEALKVEMARLDIVKTHFQFYQFFHDYMPREVRVKVVPDIVNKIPPPKHGVFSDIIII